MAAIKQTPSKNSKSLFHTHPSGFKVKGNGLPHSIIGSPSYGDLISADYRTDYVISRKSTDRYVYIYNRRGVTARIKYKAFKKFGKR